MKITAWATATLAATIAVSPVTAQSTSRAIILEPLSSDGIDRVTVRNVYGKCGSSVVQVLGVRDENDDFFSVDGNSDIVVIRDGGRQQVSLKRHMSDYNGVACVGAGSQKKVLVWSDCGGSACGHGYSFTVVDPASLRILAGGTTPCNAVCATRVTGSRLPNLLNK